MDDDNELGPAARTRARVSAQDTTSQIGADNTTDLHARGSETIRYSEREAHAALVVAHGFARDVHGFAGSRMVGVGGRSGP